MPARFHDPQGEPLSKIFVKEIHDRDLVASVFLVKDKITAMASSLNHQTPTQWAPLEELFHTRVAKAMEKMGTPSSEAFQALEARVAELEKHLAAAKPATPAKRPTRATRSK